MADYEYERDEELLEARRLKRLELKRKRLMQKRIIYGAAFLVIVLLVVLIAKSCGKPKEEDPAVPPENPGVNEPDTPAPDNATATLSAVGDIMVYDTQIADALQEDGTYNFLPSLAHVSSYLTASDITVGNFEANFAGAPYAGYPNFSAPEALATTLAGLNFKILQTANTYSIQNGLSGLNGTINTIRNQGMSTLGTYLSADDKDLNQVVIQEKNGIKIAFIGFTKGLNNMTLPEGSDYCVDLLYTDYSTNYSNIDTASIKASIEAAKALTPDVIVAMVHWGSEYESVASASQRSITDTLFANGVDVILGSHPHIVGPMEERTVTVDGREKNVFVAYSLGNFLSAMDKDNTKESVILNLAFTKDSTTGITTISSIDYVPLYIMDNGEAATNRFEVLDVYQVLADEPDEATKALMESTLTHLATNTASTYARVPISTEGNIEEGGGAE